MYYTLPKVACLGSKSTMNCIEKERRAVCVLGPWSTSADSQIFEMDAIVAGVFSVCVCCTSKD